MSKLLETLMNGLKRFSTYLSRDRVRRELLERNDRYLADIGVSRELLEEGVGAWPFRVGQAAESEAPANARANWSVRDFFSQPDFAAMNLASRGRRDYFA